jgi:hypothetical protein
MPNNNQVMIISRVKVMNLTRGTKLPKKMENGDKENGENERRREKELCGYKRHLYAVSVQTEHKFTT